MAASRVRQLKLFICLFALGASALILSNCGQMESASTGTSFASVYTVFTANNCISCHSPGGSAYDISGVELNFSTQALAYSALTTKNVTGNSSDTICGTVPIVRSADPTNSYLLAVLNSSYWRTNFYVTGCTPYNGHHSDTNLLASEKETVLSWIRDGLKQ